MQESIAFSSTCTMSSQRKFTFAISSPDEFLVFIIRPPDVREGLKFYPWIGKNFLSFFFFYQSTVLSRHAVDGHQMYSGGSVVGNASTIGIEKSPAHPLIFTGVYKCKIWRRFQHHSTLSRPRLKMQQDIRTLKQVSSTPCPQKHFILIIIIYFPIIFPINLSKINASPLFFE